MAKDGERAGGLGLWQAGLVGLAIVSTSHAAAADPPPANPHVLRIPVCSATDVMIADLDRHDADRGVGRAGAVVPAIESAMRTSGAAPYQGLADLEIVVRTDGSESFHVAWAARHLTEWEAFTAAAEHIVSKKDVRIPERSLGLKIVVRVEARLVYSDGCPVAERGGEEPFSGAYAAGCSTQAIPAPSQIAACGRRRRSAEQPSRVVHARILSEARIPDPAQPAQRTKTRSNRT